MSPNKSTPAIIERPKALRNCWLIPLLNWKLFRENLRKNCSFENVRYAKKFPGTLSDHLKRNLLTNSVVLEGRIFPKTKMRSCCGIRKDCEKTAKRQLLLLFYICTETILLLRALKWSVILHFLHLPQLWNELWTLWTSYRSYTVQFIFDIIHYTSCTKWQSY